MHPKQQTMAVTIADRLMTNHVSEKASRLQMRGPHEEDLGGYCREVVVLIIDQELNSGVPSLCSNDYCEGCGELKMYRGKPAPSLVCCDKCWNKLPKWMREAFVERHTHPVGAPEDGPSIWENRIGAALQWLRDAEQHTLRTA